MRRTLPLAALALAACAPRYVAPRDDSPTVLGHQTIPGPSPAARGPYAVRTLVYGSGTDRRRAAFRDSVAIRTRSVDASPFVSFEGAQAKQRRKYWGFEPKAFPINGRVWYPDGPGPFPLVLVVHGNHDMKESSDPGYAYLGEHLASRGMILASVDMNFLNGSARNENDARGWMLLKHLEAWGAFADSAESPLHGKVDMTRIALMGHSRGGEAVGHAAAFNAMPRYPDDANQKLGFGFPIKAIVAIAPVDGQYRPAGRLVPIENVNYLVIHGSHDGDVSTFHGLRTYQRVRFTDGRPHFKAAVSMWRANHGQWNTVWNERDNGKTSARWLALHELLPAEQQREMAKVYLTAFLEASLMDETRWLPLFRDHRAAGQWLPKTMYTTRFEESTYRPLATYEEDVDVATGTAPGVRISGDSLGTWKEDVLPFRWRNDDQRNSGAWLGWNNRAAGQKPGDSTVAARPASYTLTLPDSLARAWGIDRTGALSLALTAMPGAPGPRKAAADSAADSTKTRGERRSLASRIPHPRLARRKTPAPDTAAVDLSVELVDADGHAARVPLSRYGPVRRPLEARVYRRRGRDALRFTRTSELLLQTYVLPLADFAAAGSAFDAARLREIRLVFDRAEKGTVVLDDVGLARPNAAFLAAAPTGTPAATPDAVPTPRE